MTPEIRLLKQFRTYVANTNETIDGEWGLCRTIKELLSKESKCGQEPMEPLYYELSAKLKAARRAYHMEKK